MSEEEESVEEAFSASEEEWSPTKEFGRRNNDGESSDDEDDSDFEESSPQGSSKMKKRREPKKSTSGLATTQSKKRKPSIPTLRTKLFNKYKPPPKTSTRSGQQQTDSAKQSTKTKKDTEGSDSDSSVDDYLVDPNDLDLRSSFFDVNAAPKTNSTSLSKTSPVPQFDCNAGMNLTDSDNDDDDEEEDDDDYDDKEHIGAGAKSKKPFDFKNLLDNATNLEQAKENYAKNHKANLEANEKVKPNDGDQSMEVQSLLAIGESSTAKDTPTTSKSSANTKRQIKLSKTARQQKTQSKIAVESEDSDWEEVADESGLDDQESQTNAPANKDLQICVELPQKRHQRKDQKQAIDIEATLKRQLNREIKEKQLNLHKSSLLAAFARSMFYNKLINDTSLMEAALKLLPSKNAYPTDRTEIKYFVSLVTWFKTAITIKSDQMYILEPTSRHQVLLSLLEQINKRQALCKQSFILIFIILVRAMGLQCRLIVNLLPLPLRPNQNDLCSLKTSKSDGKKEGDKKLALSSSSSSLKAHHSKNMEKTKLSKSTPESENCKSEQSASLKLSTKLKEKATNRINGRKVLDTDADPRYENRMYKPHQQTEKSNKSFNDALAVEPTLGQGEKSKKSKKSAEVSPQLTSPIARRTRLRSQNQQNLIAPLEIKITEVAEMKINENTETKIRQSRSTSPKFHVSPNFLRNKTIKEKTPPKQEARHARCTTRKRSQSANPPAKMKKISSARIPRIEIEDESPKPKLRKLRSNSKNNPSKNTLTIPQCDGADDDGSVAKSRPHLRKLKKNSNSPSLSSTSSSGKKVVKPKKLSNEENSDDDFEPEPPKKPKILKTPVVKAIDRVRKDRRVLSTDDDNDDGGTSDKKKNTVNMWPEIWCDSEEQWICVDLFKGKVHCVDIIKKSANNSSGFAYVYAFQNDETIKDISARYCTQWCTTMRKSRVEQEWLDEALHSYYRKKQTQQDILEDQNLRRIHEEKPMPTTISEYKNHPLYALRRHLLKFEEIYPPEPPTLGFIRGEPVYARECVHTLHSREIWLKQARVVKLGEKPYKIVKARPKWDRLTRTVITDQPLEIFGYWQTQDYEPPTAENGIVPRNAYGNVELFKKCMLPKRTVHLQLPGLSRICKKLGVDCAPAVVGFDFHSGACHPTYDGFVVCEEYGTQVVAAWQQDQEEAERKEQEKYEARVYGNWKKLIRGLLIRERLKHKYNF